MLLSSTFIPFALHLLLMDSVITSPIPFRHFDRRREDTMSPHIFCAAWNSKKVCEKFDTAIVRPASTALNIIEPSQLGSEEDRQIRRIMDIKGGAKSDESKQSWLTPDAQVILWLLLLCCLIEGTVSGLQW